MTWTVTFTPQGQIGTLDCVWNAGLADEFRFTQSLSFNDGFNPDKIVSVAVEARNKAIAHVTESAAMKSKVETLFQQAFDAAGGK